MKIVTFTSRKALVLSEIRAGAPEFVCGWQLKTDEEANALWGRLKRMPIHDRDGTWLLDLMDNGDLEDTIVLTKPTADWLRNEFFRHVSPA